MLSGITEHPTAETHFEERGAGLNTQEAPVQLYPCFACVPNPSASLQNPNSPEPEQALHHSAFDLGHERVYNGVMYEHEEMLMYIIERLTTKAHLGERGAEVNTQEAPEESFDMEHHECNDMPSYSHSFKSFCWPSK